MTTDQEAENATAAVRHLLIQRGIDAREWEARCQAVTEERDAARTEIEEARQILSALENETLVDAAKDLVREEQTSNEAYQKIHTLYWKEAGPTIAALQTQLEAVQADLDRARTALQAARTYVDRMTIQVGPVAHEGIAPARHVLALIDAALGEG